MWMANKRAKHLLLLSRSGGTSQTAVQLKANLKELDVELTAPQCDIADQISLEAVLRVCQQFMLPTKGCIQASSVPKNAPFETVFPRLESRHQS